jgi:hypothetical protein
MMKLENTIRVAAVLAVILTTMLWRASPAYATACTAVAPSYPYFGVDVFASGPRSFSQCSPAGLSLATSGTDGAFGSGSAMAFATLGSLGAKATATNTAPTGSSGNAFGEGIANFADVFPVFVASTAPTSILFSFSLAGGITSSGSGFAGIDAEMSAFTGSGLGLGSAAQLQSPGTATLLVPLEVGENNILLIGLLTADADASPSFGSATSDFATTLFISKVQLLDSNGNVIQDLTLTDALGNTLQVGEVPEPATYALILAGLGVIGFVARRNLR